MHNAQSAGDMTSLEESGVQYCMSPDYTYCIVIRDHAAWYIEGEGWRDGNYPPKDSEPG